MASFFYMALVERRLLHQMDGIEFRPNEPASPRATRRTDELLPNLEKLSGCAICAALIGSADRHGALTTDVLARLVVHPASGSPGAISHVRFREGTVPRQIGESLENV